MKMKIFSLLSVLFLVISQLTSCGGAGSDINDTTAEETGANIPGNESGYDTNGYLLDDLSPDLNFGGTAITTLYWSDAPNIEFYADNTNGEMINDAIYKRNLKVEERLGVKLEFAGEQGGTLALQPLYISKVQQSILSGSAEFDIIASYSQTMPTLAQQGYLLNLLDYDCINFGKPWWPDNLIKEATVYDKLYFASGDISTNLLYMMLGTYFNKNMTVNYNREDPYSLVAENKWTVDKLAGMIKDVYIDLNQSQSKDISDQFGITVYNHNLDGLTWGAGITTTERASGGEIIISPKWSGENAINMLEKLISVFHSSDGILLSNNNQYSTFTDGRSMFAVNRASYAETDLREVDFGYGILPVPKYDENQENYTTCLAWYYTLYGIATNSKNDEAAAAVLECLASEGYRQVTPALFETSMKIKYSSDEANSQMYDIMRAGVSFDFGRLFVNSFNNYTVQQYRNCIINNNPTWASVFSSIEVNLNQSLKNIMENFDKIS